MSGKRNKTTIRVLLVEDELFVRAGLRILLESDERIVVVGVAKNLSEAQAAIAQAPPDIILLDLKLENTEGLDILPDLLAAAADARVLILTGNEDLGTHVEAVKRGAMGVVLKRKTEGEVFKAIEKVHAGELWLDNQTTQALIAESSRRRGQVDPEAEKIASLSKQHLRVIKLIRQGLKNKKIAERLFITEKTVENHLSEIYRRLEVSDRLDLFIYLQNNDVPEPTD